MPLYENSIIYKLVKQDDYDNENIYVGSTTNFRVRKNYHKTACNNPNSQDYNLKKYQYIRETEGFESWFMVQIEAFPCNSKKELETRERYWVEQLKSKLNSCIPTQTQKEYYESNKEKRLEQMAEYRKNNKEKMEGYYQNNKERVAVKVAEYYQNNKGVILEKMAEKVTCDCGCQVTKYSLSKHQKTRKHQKLMENIKK